MRLAVLECPHRTLGRDRVARKIFADVLGLRFRSFANLYETSVLPSSTLDFISDHMLIVRDDIPVAGVKFVSLDMCDFYNIQIPIYEWLSCVPKANQYLNEFSSFIDINKNLKKTIYYVGSIVIDPEISQDAKFLSEIRNVLLEAIFKYTENKKIDIGITVATPSSRKMLRKELGCLKLFEDRLHFYSYKTSMFVKYFDTSNNVQYQKSLERRSILWDNRIHISAMKTDELSGQIPSRDGIHNNHRL